MSQRRATPATVGGEVVQTVEGYGTELYSQVRWYTLDRDACAERRRHRGRHGRHAGEVLMRRPLTALGIALLALVLASACVPIRPADPPRHNTEIPQGPGLFTGEAGELVILRR
jgi:hypothetical protein